MNKIVLSAALVLATASAAFAENNSVVGERNAGPVAVQSSKIFEGRNAYEGRAQVGRIQAPAINVEKNVFDRASQTFDGSQY